MGKNKILLIGYLPKNGRQNGETKKAELLISIIKKNGNDYSLFDTSFFHEKGFAAFLKKVILGLNLIFKIKNAEIVWTVFSVNGTKKLLPIINFLKWKRKLFYFVVGIGPLTKEIKDQSKIKKLDYGTFLDSVLRSKSQIIGSKKTSRDLSKTTLVLAETSQLAKVISSVYSLSNVRVLPNFRDELTGTFQPEPIIKKNKTKKIVFFSRLTPDKGLLDIIEVADALFMDGKNFEIDIAGDTYSEKEKKLLSDWPNRHPGKAFYIGNVRDNQISFLSKYDFLLFASRTSEGMPGVIIESLAAGTPVVTCNFVFANEMIVDEFNGFIYSFKDVASFKNVLSNALSINETDEKLMRKNAKESFSKFSSKNALEKLNNFQAFPK